LVGYVAFIVILIFLYFYKPFEDFFTLVINGLGYDNAMFWVVLIAAIVGFCGLPLARLSALHRATAQHRRHGARLAARLRFRRGAVLRRRRRTVAAHSLRLPAAARRLFAWRRVRPVSARSLRW
jgi:hypothetical protein